MSDFFPIKRFDHLELYVGNAKQAAQFYSKCFGFTPVAYRGLETGSRDRASYLVEQGGIRLLLTSALQPDHAIAESVRQHGDGVAVIALEVPSAERAYREATARGAAGAVAPKEERDERGALRSSAIRAYGDTLIRYVERGDYRGHFAPGFSAIQGEPRGGAGFTPAEPRGVWGPRRSGPQLDRTHGFGLACIDHVVGNVPLGEMDRWAEFFSRTMGFTQLVHFDDDDIATEYSALMSKVMQDGSGRIKFPINEPAAGRRRSQIEEYLEYYQGPGVQHVALATGNIIATVSRLRANGVEFLRVPDTYYEQLERRVGRIDEPIEELAKHGILVDRDDEGYLLQIFTQPVVDRPTLFYEVIQRCGSRGFGQGNFKALFEAIEREQALRGNL